MEIMAGLILGGIIFLFVMACFAVGLLFRVGLRLLTTRDRKNYAWEDFFWVENWPGHLYKGPDRRRPWYLNEGRHRFEEGS